MNPIRMKNSGEASPFRAAEYPRSSGREARKSRYRRKSGLSKEQTPDFTSRKPVRSETIGSPYLAMLSR